MLYLHNEFKFPICQDISIPRSPESVLLRHRQALNKVNCLQICMYEKCKFNVRMFLRCVARVEWSRSSLVLSLLGNKTGQNFCLCSLMFELESTLSRPVSSHLRGNGSHTKQVAQMQMALYVVSFSKQACRSLSWLQGMPIKLWKIINSF